MPKSCWGCGKPASNHFEMFRVKSDWERYLDQGDRFSQVKDYAYDECHQREYCDECFEKVYSEHKKRVQLYLDTKAEIMFERALRMFERQKADMYDYKEAIDATQEFVTENPERFASSHEMLAAIILIYNEVQSKTQYKIGNYRADFFLPGLKVCLEIDGEQHKKNKAYDHSRDQKIKALLGSGYNIVRIPTSYIEQNAELLVEAIKTICVERAKGKI